MTVRILTDSTCDLPHELIAEHGITVVPLTVIFDHEALRDGIDLDANGFYERLRYFKGTPKTSQPSVAAFKEAYESLAGDASEIVSIHISSKLSGTLNSATVAREAVSHDIHIELIDSYSVSLGLGAIVLEAAMVANAGGSLAKVAAAARSAMDRTRVVAALDTLEYLRRGGRVGRAGALLGSILSIKPLIHVDAGEVAPFDKVRTRQKAIQRLFDEATKDRTLRRIFVGCGGNDDEALAFMERLRPLMPHTELHLGQIGPVVGAHAGPDVLGIATLARE